MHDATSPVDVCLISPGLPSSNPRLVKEAEALVRAGYRVHCIVGDYATPLRDYDLELIREAGATMTRVGLGSRWSYRLRRTVQLVSGSLAGVSTADGIVARTASPQTLRLARAAQAVNAKLFIGHTLAALPAAVLAAEAQGAVAGFDAEDCHSAESGNSRINEIAAAVERQFLGRCTHLTAASPLIADEYRKLYGCGMTTVLNCFDAPTGFATDRSSQGDSGALSLYWFSQTVGPGRGLEAIVVGAARAETAVRLCFRGIVSDEYRARLTSLGREAGLRIDVTFLPPEHPNRMIPGAAEHEVGLSLELREPRNRDLCLTNKLFTYIAAGIPQIVSRTAAQSKLVDELGDAAVLVDLDEPEQVAAAINRFADQATYTSAAATARRLYRERFSWTVESRRLLEAVARIVKPAGGALAADQRSDNPDAGIRTSGGLLHKVRGT